MKSNTPQVMDWIFLHEGGYAERDSEPGGAVNMGISFTAFKDWWHGTKRAGEPGWADLRALSREQAESIYHGWFFAPLRFDQLPGGVDYAFIDFAVNSGVGGSIRSTQRQMGFTVSGRMNTNAGDGPFFWAVRARPDREVIDAICEARLTLMMSSRKWPRFRENWTRRVKQVKQRAYDLAGIDETAVIQTGEVLS